MKTVQIVVVTGAVTGVLWLWTGWPTLLLLWAAAYLAFGGFWLTSHYLRQYRRQNLSQNQYQRRMQANTYSRLIRNPGSRSVHPMLKRPSVVSDGPAERPSE